MKTAVFHGEALAEIDEAASYYEGQRIGLGSEFREQLESAITQVRRFPGIGSLYLSTGFRKYVIQRFPYLAFYRELGEVIWIAAVAHTKRKPGYWLQRQPD